MASEAKPHLTLGEFLKQVREKKGLTVEVVAEQLKLKNSTVRALEIDNYNEIGSMVYVKGYLRSYAKLLNVNIEHHLQEMSEPNDHSSAEVVKKAKKTATQATAKNGESFSIWIAILLIIIIALAAYLWHHHRVNQQEEMATENAPANVTYSTTTALPPQTTPPQTVVAEHNNATEQTPAVTPTGQEKAEGWPSIGTIAKINHGDTNAAPNKATADDNSTSDKTDDTQE